MDYKNPYTNPYLATFRSEFVLPQALEAKRDSSASQDTLIFHNDYQTSSLLGNAKPHGEADQHTQINPIQRVLDQYIINNNEKSTTSENNFDRPRQVTSFEDESFAPLLLVLRRKNFTDTTELYNPATGDVLYTIHSTEKGCLSRRSDLEITSTALGGASIGTIRLGAMSSEIRSAETGTTSSNIKKFSPARLPRQTPGADLVWRSKRRTWKYEDFPRIRSIPYDTSLLWCGKELLTLELVDSKQDDAMPLCVVRLFLTMPNARFEIFAESACINTPGGDRTVLDELVLSAYANMEQARLVLMRGSDPTRSIWRSGNWCGALIVLLLAIIYVILMLLNSCVFCNQSWMLIKPV